MAVKKLETILELKSSSEKFFGFWKGQSHQVPNHSPANIQGVDLHEGDWETSGSIKVWKYTAVEGKPEIFKEKLILDEENKTVSLIGVDGDVFKIYKVYNCIWQLTPKDHGSSVKVILEYEKLNENVPAPDVYMDMVIRITKDIDQGLTKA